MAFKLTSHLHLEVPGLDKREKLPKKEPWASLLEILPTAILAVSNLELSRIPVRKGLEIRGLLQVAIVGRSYDETGKHLVLHSRTR